MTPTPRCLPVVFFLCAATQAFISPSLLNTLPRPIENKHRNVALFSISLDPLYSGEKTSGDIADVETLPLGIDVVNDILVPIPSEITTLTLDVVQHTPLGCTVEESLAKSLPEEDNGVANQVFVTKITPGGNAEKHGLVVGDVIVEVINIFGTEMVGVEGMGLERIRSLIIGTDPDDPLKLTVRRGTTTKLRHDTALASILSEDTSSVIDQIDHENHAAIASVLASVEESVVTHEIAATIHTEECFIDDSSCCADDDDECVLDMFWNALEEESTENNTDVGSDDTVEVKKKKPAPWSSRSSGSGTYVRNPATGKLENIDA